MTRSQIEYRVLGAIGIIMCVLLVNAVLHARTVIRDDLRKADIANLKRAVEMFNNQHNFYPTPPDGVSGCATSSDPASWFFGSTSLLLHERHIDAIPHDLRERAGRAYRYCASQILAGVATGFYFEAELEVNEPEIIAFDEDEHRKFDYRILHEQEKTLYRVCGGTETQCTTEIEYN